MEELVLLVLVEGGAHLRKQLVDLGIADLGLRVGRLGDVEIAYRRDRRTSAAVADVHGLGLPDLAPIGAGIFLLNGDANAGRPHYLGEGRGHLHHSGETWRCVKLEVDPVRMACLSEEPLGFLDVLRANAKARRIGRMPGPDIDIAGESAVSLEDDIQQSLPVDRRLDRLDDLGVVERGLGHVHDHIHEAGIRAGYDVCSWRTVDLAHLGGSDLAYDIGLSRQQRLDQGGRLVDLYLPDTVEIGQPGAPVVRIADQFPALARREAGDLERAGADGSLDLELRGTLFHHREVAGGNLLRKNSVCALQLESDGAGVANLYAAGIQHLRQAGKAGGFRRRIEQP